MTALLLGLISGLVVGPTLHGGDIEGKWYGQAGFATDRVEMGLEFKRNPERQLRAYLYQPVINFYGLELPGAVVSEDGKFAIKELTMEWTVTDNRIVGTYTSLHVPFVLARTRRLPAEVKVPNLSPGRPVWRYKLGGAIWAGVAARDGVAYVGTASGVFDAVDLKDGSIKWAFGAGRPVHGEPLVTEDAVYFVCDNGFLFRLERSSGKEVWRYDLGDAQVPRVLPDQTLYDYDFKSPRPLLEGGAVYVGSGANSFHAVDAATGKRLWRYETTGKVRTDAIVSGPNVVFGCFDNFVYCVERTSGVLVWKRETRAAIDGSPALIDGKIIVGNHGSVLNAIDATTGEFAWRSFYWGSAVESTPVQWKDRFYIGASDLRRVTCYNPKDARVVWRTDVFGWAWGRPLVTEDTVFIGTGGSDPYQMRHLGGMVALDRATGKIVWRWAMPQWPGSTLNGFTGSPVLSGSTVVIGGLDGSLYGFSLRGATSRARAG